MAPSPFDAIAASNPTVEPESTSKQQSLDEYNSLVNETRGAPQGVQNIWDDSRRTYESTYSNGMAGVEGGLGAGIASNLSGYLSDNLSTLRAGSLRDEAELLEYCQQEQQDREEAARNGTEYRPSTTLKAASAARFQRKLYLPKSRQALERLDEELTAFEHKRTAEMGVATNFRAQVACLVKEFQVHLPTIHVRYNNVTVETDALVGSAGIPTVGNAFTHMLQGFVGIKPKTVKHTILNNIRGVLVPGRLTLLLGPPSSGKSTLLKVLAGRYQDSAHLRVQGDITYNGHSFDQFQVNRTSAFISQNDVHIPRLTVFETLMFSYVCQQGIHGEEFNVMVALREALEAQKLNKQSSRASNANAGSSGTASEEDSDESQLYRQCSTSEELKNEIISMGEKVYLSGIQVLTLMRALGILHTKDTLVGDSMVRGVSGGERKRVTVTEMLVGRRKAMFLDEISTGLDSATLYSIIKQLGEYVRSFQVTCMVSLLQPPPEVYDLFDDLCLMSEGNVVYHGPVSGALDFFTSLGFVCPPRKDVPSFLQEVTTPSGQREYASQELLRSNGITQSDSPDQVVTEYLVPVADVVSRFWETDTGRSLQAQVDTPYDTKLEHPAALVKSRYALSPLEALAVVTRFQIKLVSKDPVLIKGRLIQIIIIGLLIGGLFYQESTSLQGSRSLLGALFLAVMFTAMGAMPQMAIAMSTKPVWYKWRDNQFYPGWIHAAAVTLAQLPVSAIDAAAWSIITYFMWGLSVNAGNFFTYYLVLFAMSLSCGSLFRMIAYAAPDGVAANSFGGLVFLILVVMSGFSIVRRSIPPWWIWAYYISPFAWAMRSVTINEFTSAKWDVPSTTGSGHTLGQDALLSFDFFTQKYWIWAGVGFLFGTVIIFTFLSGLALQYLTPTRVARVADEEELAEARRLALERKQVAAAREAEQKARCEEAKNNTAVPPTVVQLNAGGRTASGALRTSLQQPTDRFSACRTASQVLAQPCVMIDMSKVVIPFTPITLVFQELKYIVPNPAAKKNSKQPGAEVGPPDRLELLKGITGWSKPYTLTALMGGSGAGKTTLMDCIAGRKTVGEITGRITVNGHPKEQRTFARVCGYCEQMDIHTPAQTVKEALLFSAKLRLPASVSKHQMESYVEEVMDIVELTPIQFDLVGVPAASGLSVEQRKRLTIGVELVANPSVVFMDEPTSGLDARAAAIVMRAVRNVARNGRAVLVTIHQPSIEIFEAFDNLLLLQRGGRTTYFGPLGKESHDLVNYLQSVPDVPHIQPGQNPSTWMLEVTGGAVAVSAKAVDVDWPALYANSPLGKANAATAQRLVEEAAASHDVLTVEGGEFAVTLPTQLLVVLRKYTRAYWRTPSYNFTRYYVTCLVAVLYGSIYYKVAHLPVPAQAKDVQNVMGVLFSSSSFLGMTNMMAAMPILGLERVVFYRERAASMYSPWAFSFALSFVELPYILTQVTVFVLILYWMVGFVSTAGHFFWYLMLFLQSISFYTAMGMAVVNITPSQQLAQVIGSGINFLCNVFNGFVIPRPAIAPGFVWINRIVPTTWILYGLAADQLGDNHEPLVYPANPSVNTVSKFLSTVFGFQYSFHWWTVLIMVAYIAFLRVAAVLALRYISFLRR